MDPFAGVGGSRVLQTDRFDTHLFLKPTRRSTGQPPNPPMVLPSFPNHGQRHRQTSTYGWLREVGIPRCRRSQPHWPEANRRTEPRRSGGLEQGGQPSQKSFWSAKGSGGGGGGGGGWVQKAAQLTSAKRRKVRWTRHLCRTAVKLATQPRHSPAYTLRRREPCDSIGAS